MERNRNICFLNKHNTHSNEFRSHMHNCYEIVYILSGSGRVVIGDETHRVSRDTYYVVSPKTPHTEQFDGYGEILFVGFECRNEGLVCPNRVYSANADMLEYFKKIIEEYKRQGAEYEIAAGAFLDLLLVSTLRNINGTSRKCRDIEYIKAYIEQYFNQKINFGRLAKLSGYSYDYFRHIFKQRFGIAPQDYLMEVRLENAKRLLNDTKLTCTEIAYNCGFSSGAQMSMLFKKRFGSSPTAYKKADRYKNNYDS